MAGKSVVSSKSAAAPIAAGMSHRGLVNGVNTVFLAAFAGLLYAGSTGVLAADAVLPAAAVAAALYAVAVKAIQYRIDADIKAVAAFCAELETGNLDARIAAVRGAEFKGLADNANRFTGNMSRNLREGFGRIAEGDILVDHIAGGRDDMMAKTLARLSGNLSKTLEGVKQSGDVIVSSSSQISAAGDRISRNTANQAAALDQIGGTIESFSAQIRQGKEMMDNVSGSVLAAKRKAEDGNVGMDRLNVAVLAIEQASRDISGIVQDLNDIADSINLLALNAAIEAARAGDAGKGFAVVADNVRTLSNKSQKLAKDAEKMIQNCLEKSQEGLEISKDNHRNFREIAEEVGKMADLLGGAGKAAERQVTAVSQITGAIKELEGVSHSNLRSISITAKGAEHLLEEAMKLKAAVAKFHTRKERIIIEGAALEDENGNILWHDMLSVRHRKIDEQHRELVALINAVNQARDAAVLQIALGKLVDYVKVHFTYEENTMRKGGYPDSDAHREIHESLLHQVGVITQHKLADRDLLLDFLKDWLVNHILGSDKKYTPFVQNLP